MCTSNSLISVLPFCSYYWTNYVSQLNWLFYLPSYQCKLASSSSQVANYVYWYSKCSSSIFTCVGSYVHSVSNVVYYYAISRGSCSYVFCYTRAIYYYILCVSASSLFYVSGNSMHLGDASISWSPAGPSQVLAIFLVYTIMIGDSECAEKGRRVFPRDKYFVCYGLVCFTCWYVVSCCWCLGYITSIIVVRKLTSYIGLLVYSQLWVYLV